MDTEKRRDLEIRRKKKKQTQLKDIALALPRTIHLEVACVQTLPALVNAVSLHLRYLHLSMAYIRACADV